MLGLYWCLVMWSRSGPEGRRVVSIVILSTGQCRYMLVDEMRLTNWLTFSCWFPLVTEISSCTLGQWSVVSGHLWPEHGHCAWLVSPGWLDCGHLSTCERQAGVYHITRPLETTPVWLITNRTEGLSL